MSSRWYIDKIRGVRSSVPECSTSVGIGAYATSPRLRGTKQTDPPRPKGRSSSKGHTITRFSLSLSLSCKKAHQKTFASEFSIRPLPLLFSPTHSVTLCLVVVLFGLFFFLIIMIISFLSTYLDKKTSRCNLLLRNRIIC